MTERPPPLALGAFAAMVVIGGLNFVAVRFSNAELAPLWGAGGRFVLAALLFLGIMAAMRLPSPPAGAARQGIVVYGLLAFFLAYALIYYALTELTAGLASVAMALVPMVTVLLAPLHGVERFRTRGLVGSIVAALGIAIIFRSQLQADASLPHMLALLAFVVVAAEGTVLIKRYPRVHPVTANAGGMAVGGLLLLLASVATQEPLAVPTRAKTWVAVAYLVLVGSGVLFFLFRYVVDRWTASATNYQFVLMPVVAIPAGALLAGEAVRLDFLLGAVIVLVGVYIGVISKGRSAPTVPPPPVRTT